MEKVIDKLSVWINELGITTNDQTTVILVALCAILVVLVILLFLKSRRSPAAQASRLSGSLQDLILRFEDVTSKLSSEQTRLKEQVKQLTFTISRLENELSTVTGRKAEPLAAEQAQAVEKKTLETTKSTLTPAPVAVPVAPAASVAPTAVLEQPTGFWAPLAKTRTGFFARVTELFRRPSSLTEDTVNSLEELLIQADVGVATTAKILGHLRSDFGSSNDVTEPKLIASLKHIIYSILYDKSPPEIKPLKRDGNPLVILIVGVNGVGKTTTIAKLSRQFSSEGAKVLIGACDTFRAAAADQLAIWAERIGAELVMSEEDAKPATVAYQAVHRAKNEGFDVLILDTAGRLHTRTNLMQELGNLIRIVSREQEGAPHETLLVVDASTGQNALAQAREFHSLCNLSGVVVTKLDGTPKGGIVIAIRDELGVPIRYLGVGEKAGDLRPFNTQEFVDALFEVGTESAVETSAEPQRYQRKRRGVA